jgi:hypothetical protein
MKRFIRTLVAVVIGYPLMGGLITLVQENWFGGVGWHGSPIGELFVAGFLTCVGSAIGAVVATAIAANGRIPALIMSGLVIVETTWLVTSGRADGPLWFDALAASSLIVAILTGTELFLWWRRRLAIARGSR